MRELPSSVRALCARQDGVVGRRQLLAAGAGASEVRGWLHHRLLVTMHPGVYVDHTGTLTWRQRAWAAVLWAEPAHLYGRCALVAEGVLPALPGAPVQVAIDARRTLRQVDGVVVRRVRAFAERHRSPRTPPRAHIEDATLDYASVAGDEHAAVAVLAAAVGSRRTTPARLQAALQRRTRIARRSFLNEVLTDVADGACSVLERAYLRDVERAHGLPRGSRQVRASIRGAVYRDVEYEDFGVVVELDGRLSHTDPEGRDRDLDRDLDAAGTGRTTVRLGWGQVFGRRCATAVGIAAVLRRHGWSGAATRCPHC